MTIIRHSSATHVGRVRTVNEDSVLSMPDRRIWAVSDGMGGHEAGDFASQTVVEAIATIPAGPAPGDTMRAIRAAVLDAHRTIRAEAARRGVDVVGATVVVLHVADGHFVAFWAGDSRLYRFRDGVVELLTSDHSVVGELVAAGAMTWDEGENHPHANRITRAVGVGDVLELDKIRGEIRSGDRFLICSDGLTRYASFEVLRQLVSGTPIEVVCGRLVQYTLDRGAADNVSVVVVDVA
jgi:serine/threonine protein phosphatase PrpC